MCTVLAGCRVALSSGASCVVGSLTKYCLNVFWFLPSFKYAALAVFTLCSHHLRTDGRLFRSLFSVVFRQLVLVLGLSDSDESLPIPSNTPVGLCRLYV